MLFLLAEISSIDEFPSTDVEHNGSSQDTDMFGAEFKDDGETDEGICLVFNALSPKLFEFH